MITKEQRNKLDERMAFLIMDEVKSRQEALDFAQSEAESALLAHNEAQAALILANNEGLKGQDLQDRIDAVSAASAALQEKNNALRMASNKQAEYNPQDPATWVKTLFESGLVALVDEAKLDAELATKKAEEKAERIATLEAELAKLKK